MKRSLENIIKLLKAMEDNSRQLKEKYMYLNNEKWSNHYKIIECELYDIQCILEDKDMFDRLCVRFNVTEENK